MLEKLKKRYKLKAKQRVRRPFAAYFLGVIFLMFFLLVVFEIAPNTTLVYRIIRLPSLWLFFLSLYLTVFFFAYFISSKVQATLISSFICFYLILRFIGLTHPIFLVITFGLYITLALFFRKRK